MKLILILIKDLVKHFPTDTKYINEKELIEGNYKYIPNSGVSIKHRDTKNKLESLIFIKKSLLD